MSRILSILTVLLAAALACSASNVIAAEPAEPDFSSVLPRFPPVEPKDALATMKVQPGFRMELVASEPLIGSPVAIAWDERGRMYVVEMRGYSEHRDEKLSRIKLLTDANDDGVYDEAKVFAEGLLWPTAIICWDGGVFVGDAPDILYLKDTDGDGKADERRRVYTGFGTQNVQGLLNTFLWGLDGRIHGATSSNGGEVRLATERDEKGVMKPLSLRGRDFSFDPSNEADIRAESGGGQHGMTFDDWGRKFVSSNSDHVQQIMYEDRYLAANPSLAAPSPRVSIAADGPQAPVFRASPIEPWRVLRTRLRVEGKVPGPIEGGGKPAGYFTGATGITMIRGDAFDEQVRGTLVVGDVGSNLIHRKRLKLGSKNSGLEYVAERIDQESELVASTDTWFRPAQFANGPDGGLYIIDVYREVIEHPASLPPAIKKHLDLDSGRDRGRIWRLVPEGFQRRPTPRLDQLDSLELARLLGHPNAWHRETAALLLRERKDPELVKTLERFAKHDAGSPLRRIHSLRLVQALRPEFTEDMEALLIAMLRTPDPLVQREALRCAEGAIIPKGFGGRPQFSSAVAAELLQMCEHADRQVRFQLAWTLVRAREEDSHGASLAKLLLRDAADPWMRLACTLSVSRPYTSVIAKLLREPGLRRDPGQRSVLAPLLQKLGALDGEDNPFAINDEQNRITPLMQQLLDLPDEDAVLAYSIARRIGGFVDKWKVGDDSGAPEACRRATASLGERALRRARTVLADRAAPLAVRQQVLGDLAEFPYSQISDLVSPLLSPHEPRELQIAALDALGRFREPEAGKVILRSWPQLSPELRRTATSVLVSRPERCEQLLDAVERGELPPGELERSQVESLRGHANAAIRDRARRILASVMLARRQDVVDAYCAALESKGDTGRGKALFAKNCSACHRLEEVGSETGPSLAAMKARGVEAILLNVLDPNREVNPQYLTYVVTTKDGRTFSGMISAETATSVTLRQADGRSEAILRENIEELRGTGLSLMPEGLEKQLDQAAMADLLAYLMQVK